MVRPSSRRPKSIRNRRSAGRVTVTGVVTEKDGKKMVEEAGNLYAKAAAMSARDAMEKLDVEMAKSELA